MTKPLTVKSVENFKSDPDKRREIPDGVSGLYFVIQPSGARSWAFRYRYQAQPRKLTLGPYPLLGLGDAREKARGALNALDHGRDPASEKAAAKADDDDRERDLFPSVLTQFIERYAKVKNKRPLAQARLLGLRPENPGCDKLVPVPGDLAEHWANKRVQEITKRDVLDWIDTLIDRGANTNANRILANIRRFFSWCVERDLIAVSPCNGVRDPLPKGSRDRVLSDDEIRWLWNAAGTLGYPFGPAIKMLLLTGQRLTEVADMTARELLDDDRTWVLPAERVKNGLQHEVPLLDAALTVLRSLPQIGGTTGYVFTTTGETPISGFSKCKANIDASTLKLARSERGPDASIPPWVLHDLRRTMSTWMHDHDIEPHIVEAALNHVSGHRRGVAGTYNHARYRQQKRRAHDLWGHHVNGLYRKRTLYAQPEYFRL